MYNSLTILVLASVGTMRLDAKAMQDQLQEPVILRHTELF
jgi:hypothetical protein